MADLAAIFLSDPPDIWADLGFAVDENRVRIGPTTYVLGEAGKGLVAVSITGLPALDGETQLDGLPLRPPPDRAPEVPGEHPNGVYELDHLVVFTPDLQRTIEALEAAGLDLRRTRDTDTSGAPMRQAFFKLGPTILEVVGGPEATGDGPARLFGLAFTVRDLDATAAFLGDALRPPKDAVQRGRRIATLDRGVGSKVPTTFMSPEPPR
jgi:hypothetical protein